MINQTIIKIKENSTMKKINIFNEAELEEECNHYWLIQSADGPISQGICRLCGTQRNFDNYLTTCLKNK